MVRDRDNGKRILYWYLALQAMTYWGLIVVCYLLIPPENHFGFMSHSFSYLGGFDACHNPEWWWMFSITMTFWGVSLVPIVIYIFNRFKHVSCWAACVGALLLLVGCLGICLVGIIPTGHGIPGGFDWGNGHRQAGLLTAFAFGIGIFWHELMLFYDGFSKKNLGKSGYWKFVCIYTFWWTMAFLTTYFLVRWMFVYENMKAEAAATGSPISGSWTEALNTRYSIPMWENIMIITLYIFLVWFPLLLPGSKPKKKI